MQKKLLFIALILLAAALLSGCASGSAARGSTSWPGLAADSENVYLADGSHVYAVSLKDGKEVWRYPEKPSSSLLFFAPPLLTEDGQLIVGSEGNDHHLFSLDPKTGKEKWVKPFAEAKDRWIASPLILNNRIYAPNADGFIYVLDMNGKQLDTIEVGGALWSSPATDGTLIYIASLDHHFHVINPAKKAMNEPIDLGGAAPGGTVVGPEGAYVGSFSSKIESIKSNGERKALAQTENWVWGRPTLDGTTLYYADLNGNVYSLDITTGKQNWGTVKPDGPIVASPLVYNDLIIVATEVGSVVALDRDGKNVWEREVGGKIYSNTAASGELILVSPVQSEFYLAALDVDGKLAWTFKPEN